jgi:parvulin-like peptidyl-prolyl isomerase
VLARLAAEEDFAELAQELSIDEVSRESEISGHLGWFPEGIMSEEFDEVVFSLETGAASEPFFSPQGYWILWVLEEEENRPLAEAMKQQLGAVAFTDWLQDQRGQKVERNADAIELEEVHQWAVGKIG